MTCINNWKKLSIKQLCCPNGIVCNDSGLSNNSDASVLWLFAKARHALACLRGAGLSPELVSDI